MDQRLKIKSNSGDLWLRECEQVKHIFPPKYSGLRWPVARKRSLKQSFIWNRKVWTRVVAVGEVKSIWILDIFQRQSKYQLLIDQVWSIPRNDTNCFDLSGRKNRITMNWDFFLNLLKILVVSLESRHRVLDIFALRYLSDNYTEILANINL